MLENATAMTPIGEKHVDTHYHFVREVMFDKFVKIVFFVRSEENKSDNNMFTNKCFKQPLMRNIRMIT
jgi:hypothetical protein